MYLYVSDAVTITFLANKRRFVSPTSGLWDPSFLLLWLSESACCRHALNEITAPLLRIAGSSVLLCAFNLMV